jgi:hypothetical protein
MSRGLPLSEAMAHVGLKRRTFDSLIRPRVTPIRVGTSLIFDVHDLDRAFDELKSASQAPDTSASAAEPAQNVRRNGRPIPQKGVESWADQHGGSTPTKAVPGRSTRSGAALDFASAVSQVLAKRRPG